uniref:Uncharacterized protein n=1 Tax=Oryza sativa subsp. japonica TaxID=39947 RepID=Q6YWP3_ORYSJ|nr:hypothetical protein [Oryza sativa Japonica Group]BAD13256.1 hypothetical protein [Oryza sativa Japonica Group]
MERIDRIWKETAVACASVSGGGGGARKTKTDRWDPPVSDSEGARACGCGWTRPTGPREREREGFGPTFGPKPKETFKNFFPI